MNNRKVFQESLLYRILTPAPFLLVAVMMLISPTAAADQDEGAANRADTGGADAIAAERERAIAALRETINAEREAAGGSWEAWSDKLKPFRKDVERIIANHGWPWPAQHDFRFYGASWRLMKLDEITGGDGARPADAIVQLDRELRARGIDLILMPIPDKLAVYADYLSEEAPTPAEPHAAMQVRRLMHELAERDVEVIDLYTPYAAWRRDRIDSEDDHTLYYDRDGHWRNIATQLAADKIAERLSRYEFVREAKQPPPRFETRDYQRTDGDKADDVKRVIDADSGDDYRDIDDSPIIVTGDSFSMYNMHLGGHLSAQVAKRINMPTSVIWQEGLGSDMPVELARRHRERDDLEGRRVVIWTFAGRHFQRDDWRMVHLQPPRSLDEPARELAARGRIAALSDRPRTDAAYPDFIMKLHVKNLVDAEGRAIGDGEAVVRIAAMRERELLPAAELEAGDGVDLALTSWSLVEDDHGQTATGSLPDPTVELAHPHFWAEPDTEAEAAE